MNFDPQNTAEALATYRQLKTTVKQALFLNYKGRRLCIDERAKRFTGKAINLLSKSQYEDLLMVFVKNGIGVASNGCV